MSDFLKTTLVTACLLFSVSICSAQKAKPKALPSKNAALTKVDLGRLASNTYTNNFFGLKFEFPLGWLVGDNVLEKQMQQISQSEIQTQNPRDQKSLNTAVDRVTVLLGGYKKMPGMPDNASLRVAVENLRALPQIKTGKAYLSQMLTSFKAIKLPAGFKYSEIQTETVDNLPLDFLEVSAGGNTKRMYAMVRKGYAVSITISYYETVDFEALHKVLTEADLHYKN